MRIRRPLSLYSYRGLAEREYGIVASRQRKANNKLCLKLKTEYEGNVGLGALLAFGLYVLQTGIILVLADGMGSLGALLFILVFVPPVSQFLYIVPLYKERKTSGQAFNFQWIDGWRRFHGN